MNSWFVINIQNTLPKSVSLLALALSITLGAACGGFAGGAPDNPSDFILEDSVSVELTNYKDILGAASIPARLGAMVGYSWDVDEFQDELRDAWDDDGIALETAPDAVEQVALIRTENTTYAVIKGDFDFEDMKEALEDEDYDDGTYREREIWEEDGLSVALFEGSGIYVAGESGIVKKILRAIDQGEGFMETSDELRQALDRVERNALAVRASTNCSRSYASDANGCRAIAIAVIGGDEDTTMYTNVAVFSSERRAETALDDIGESIENAIDDGDVDMDLDEIQRNGEIVTFKTTVHE